MVQDWIDNACGSSSSAAHEWRGEVIVRTDITVLEKTVLYPCAMTVNPFTYIFAAILHFICVFIMSNYNIGVYLDIA